MAEKETDQAAGSAGRESNQDRASPQRSPRHGVVPASPPKFFSLEQMMDASNLVSNMKLAHEITLDNDFKLEKLEPAEGSIEKQVADTMKRAFWDALTEKLEADPPDYSHAVVLIQEVKEKLVKCLLPQHTRMLSQINEIIDLDLVKQKIEHGAFEIDYYASFVCSVMSQLCAPARDDEIAKLKDIGEIVPLFQEIFRLLDIMHIDMANYTIQQMRPYLQEQSINYERTKFEQFLLKEETAGIDGLEYTREWIERSHEALEEHKDGSDLFWTNISKSIPITPATILRGAYMELLNWADHIYPESCLLDQQRFVDLAFNLRRLALISSTILITCSTVGPLVSECTNLKNKLKADILAIMADVPETEYRLKMVSIADYIVKEVNSDLIKRGYGAREEGQQTLLKDQILAVSDRSHSVHSLLWRRIMAFIFQSLGHNSSQPLQLPAGLGVVSSEISQLCGKFLQLVSHNRAVFGHWYANIVAVLMNVDLNMSPRPPASDKPSTTTNMET